MIKSVQQLRNLTTGRLHTNIGDVYRDIEFFTGAPGVMTHMLPRAATALEPYLRSILHDPRFWDGEYDAAHTGDVDVEPMPADELDAFWKRYAALPSPLFAKE